MVEIDETEADETNHVVATGINCDVMVTQYHLLRNNGCRLEKNNKFRHSENQGSHRIKHLLLVHGK